jgi:hypothetical protein
MISSTEAVKFCEERDSTATFRSGKEEEVRNTTTTRKGK